MELSNSDKVLSSVQFSNDEISSNENKLEEVSLPTMKVQLQKCTLCKNEKITDHAFLLPCKHGFCLNCILMWNRAKKSCPNCDKSIVSIIHDVISSDKFSESSLVHHANTTEGQIITTEWKAPDLRYEDRITKNHDNIHKPLFDLFLHYSVEIERFSIEHSKDVVPPRRARMKWRKYIYETGMYAIPLLGVGERRHESYADYYIENEQQAERLWPWLHRELCVLFGECQGLYYTLNRLKLMLWKHDILSPDCELLVEQLAVPYADHFIHEFYNFAISPFDMMTYDTCVPYKPYFNERNENESTTISSMLPDRAILTAAEKKSFAAAFKQESESIRANLKVNQPKKKQLINPCK